MIEWQDAVNGTYELLGAPFMVLNVLKLAREKVVAGVSLGSVAFFVTWGFWNLYYYPHLDQWISFAGGIAIVAVNAFWLAQMAYYIRRPGGERPPQLKDLEHVADERK